MQGIQSMISWESFQQILFFLTTLAGACISQLLSLHKDFEGCQPFLKKAFPKKSKRWYFISNALLLPIIGTVLAFIILEPDNVKASLCAGLTWCGTLQTLGLSAKKDD
jgi:hypothetical protein